MTQTAHRHRVVIIGSGFGGLFAAKALRRAEVDVTVIDRTSHHLFQPLLYQVATGILSEGEIAPPTRDILRRQQNARVLLGNVETIDLTARTVTHTILDKTTVTPYDSLIVAAGSSQSYFGNDHFAEFAPGMKSIDDALELRGRIFGAYELAELEDDPIELDAWLTFVVVGRRADRRRDGRADRRAVASHAQSNFRRIDPSTTRVVLLDAATRSSAPSATSSRRTRGRARGHGRRGAARRDGGRRRRARHRGQGEGRHDPAHRGPHEDLGRRRRRLPAR
jgi:NADH dehydrogenase